MAKKKSKYKTKSIIYLIFALIVVVLGLVALSSRLNLFTKAGTPNCLKGIYLKGGDGKCYEVNTDCGNVCCNKEVDNSFCRNSKYKPETKCKGEGYSTGPVDGNKGQIGCFLINGKVCKSGGIDPKSGEPIGTEYCCNKRVADRLCGL